MVRWNTLLRRQVAEHRRLLMIGAAHKTILYDYVLTAKSPTYFFRSLLEENPALVGVDKTGQKLCRRGDCRGCPSRKENQDYTAESLRWLFRNLDLGGVQIETGDYGV